MTPSIPLVTTCPACTRLTRVRASPAAEPLFITELRESFVYLHEHQAFPGWCVLVLKDHAEHLHELSALRQSMLWEDVAQVAQAIRRSMAPNRLNYACLGNQLAHVHWHVIPRFVSPQDPAPGKSVWEIPASQVNVGVTSAAAIELIARLRAAGLDREG